MKTQLKEHIFLIGFMGVGKTATSHALSKLSGAKEFDTDQMIVKQEHKSIPDIFAEEGEEYFRQRETEILTRLRDLEPGIISCGGGMVMREARSCFLRQRRRRFMSMLKTVQTVRSLMET